MKIIRETFQFSNNYPLENWGDLNTLLFFDIETTGFSANTSSVYLIGCVYYADHSWNIIQWFADTRSAEADILADFFQFTKNYKTLIHFNGDRFDIPFLLKRCAQFNLEFDFNHLHSIDIYKQIKPFKKWLCLDSLKQKSIEQFLGIRRLDQFSGGELIEIYYQYLQKSNPTLYHLLMLHNADDLKGMTAILPILSYVDFFHQNFQLVQSSISSIKDIFGDDHPQLRLSLSHDIELSVELEKYRTPFQCQTNGKVLNITIDLTKGTLKHFYTNYKDYYYLPYEDMAIHKSVGEYVEKSAREKATSQTCYIKKDGLFLPQLKPIWEPLFYKNHKDVISYSLYQEDLLSDPAQLKLYIRQILDYLNC